MNYENLIEKLAKEDEQIMVMTAENRMAIRNLPNKLDNQFLDVGIAEQTLIGMAAGLALRGRIPIVHALSSFLTMRAFEFIRTDIGIPNLQVVMVGSFGGFLSEANGPTHQALEDIALMRLIPNVNIFCPTDEEDLLIGMAHIIKSKSPTYIRYNSQSKIVDHSNEFSIGKAEIIYEGEDAAILTYGTLFNQAVKAADLLRLEGLSVKLINLRSIKPIDANLIIQTCKNIPLVVTLEDHFITGGLFSIVCELLVKFQIQTRILPLALEDKWFKPLLLKEILEYEGFTFENIANRILSKVDNKKQSAVQYFF